VIAESDLTKRRHCSTRARDQFRGTLHWHDLRHEGACRLLVDGVDIRTIQLMLGHADIKQTQRYLNITDEELRKAMTGMWERRRQLKAVSQWRGAAICPSFVSRGRKRASAARVSSGRHPRRSWAQGSLRQPVAGMQ
jgi:hypothetical protein